MRSAPAASPAKSKMGFGITPSRDYGYPASSFHPAIDPLIVPALLKEALSPITGDVARHFSQRLAGPAKYSHQKRIEDGSAGADHRKGRHWNNQRGIAEQRDEKYGGIPQRLDAGYTVAEEKRRYDYGDAERQHHDAHPGPRDSG